MALPRTTRPFLPVALSIGLLAGCSEPATDNDVEREDAPTVEILAGPEVRTSASEAHFAFQCVDEQSCSFFCRLDDGPSEPCGSPVSFEGLDDGAHIFEVFAVDDFDRESAPAQWSWTIDTVLPAIVDLTGPVEFTDEADATLNFGCSKPDCTFECALDDAPLQSCQSPITYEDLEDGEYVFSVRATDDVGNVGAISTHSWTLDGNSPWVVGLQGPQERTNETWATFVFDCSEANCTFSCQLNDAAPQSCASGITFDDLADGQHLFVVTATDEAGDSGSPVEWIWTIDTVTPVIALSATIDGGSAQFEFECTNKSDCSLHCALAYDFGIDDWEMGPWEPCSSPETMDGLEPGSYEFFVQATDGAGNQATESYIWTIAPRRWVMTSGRWSHTCSIAEDSSLWCWGWASSGRLGLGNVWDNQSRPQQVLASDPDLATGWEAVVTGSSHTCAIRIDGSLWCWGEGMNGRLGLGDTTSRNTPQRVLASDPDLATGWETVTTGQSQTCAIRTDGSLWCWGAGGHGLGDTATYSTPQQVLASDPDLANGWGTVSAGNGFTCAVRNDGTLWCWGNGTNGKLGLGDTTTHNTPQQVLASDPVLSNGWSGVSAGRDHTCAVRVNGSLWCWGAHWYGKLGLGDTSTQTTPQQVLASDLTMANGWETVSAGWDHSCALRTDGSLWCWGNGSEGRLGLGDTMDRTTPHQVLASDTVPASGWSMVSVGRDHTCALESEGEQRCWGERVFGQLGDGVDHGDKLVPHSIALSSSIAAIDAGTQHGCAIAEDSTLWCWGNGMNGRLGTGGTNHETTPQQVLESDPDLAAGWSTVSAGSDHTCAIRIDGSLWCWGWGSFGRLGLGDTTTHVTPRQVLESDPNLAAGWSTVSAGSDHTCATRIDGSLWCWGVGAYGRLGLGDMSHQNAPQQLLASDPVLATGWSGVSAAREHTCAVRTDDSLWCWGRGTQGRLGLNDTSNQSTPQHLLADDPALFTGWESVFAGLDHTCAVRTDGSLWCWGLGGSGRLGLGTTSNQITPQQVLASDPDLSTGWDAVAAGLEHTCATRTEGSLWCWGLGWHGRLGLGSLSSYTTPQQVGSELTWTNVSAGWSHTLAIRSTGAGRSWGDNGLGQLGDGTRFSTKPVLVY